MKYLVLICSTIAILACLWAYVLDYRLTTTKKELTLSEAEKTALKMEVKNYNEKSIQANRQIGELKKLIQDHKDDSSMGYLCFNTIIPDDIINILRK